jgi:hypothetical protein
MFGFIEIITGAKAVVPLVPGVIKVIEKLNEDKQDPTLARIVQQARLDTLEGALKLRSELLEVLQDRTMDAQLDVPLKQLGNDLSWLTDPLKKRRVQKYRDRIDQIHRDLTTSTDDLAAILACMQRTNGLGDAYVEAEAVRRDLDGLLSNQPPLRKVIESYINFLERYIKRLQS